MNYIETCKEVVLRPFDFYRRMPTTGGYSEPVIFAVITLIISLLLNATVSYGMFILGIRSSILTFGSIPFSESDFSIISYMIELFFMPLAGIFIGSLILNLVYTAFGGTGSYEGTVRFMSYGYAIQLISWIPLLNLIALIYAIYIVIVGGSFVHNVSMGRSALVVLLVYPVTIFIITVIIATLVTFISILFGLSGFD
jgi:hypothetical protein